MNISKSLQALLAATVLATVPLALATPAWAHAALVQAVPAVGATIGPPAPAELRLSFSEPLELAFTKVTVIGGDGQPAQTGPLALDPADAKILVVPLTGALAAGVVTVNWTAVADDGHKSNGTYSLTITK
jgi:methionine-rich copper-binding protein CopC